MAKPIYREFILFGLNRKILSFRLSSFFSFLSCFFIICCVSFSIFSILFPANIGLYALLNFYSDKKFCVLQKNLKNLEQQTNRYEQRSNLIFTLDDNIRKILGHNAISDEIKQAGVGGTKKKKNGICYNSILGKALEIEERTSRLVRQNQLQKSSSGQLKKIVIDKMYAIRCLPALWPTRGYVTSSFGNRFHPVYYDVRFHSGVDIVNEEWTPIFAVADGTAKTVSFSSTYGNFVEIQHGNGYTTFYAHLNRYSISEGQYVKRGDLIGYMGSSGVTTGPHLHYEVRYLNKPVDPEPYLLPLHYSMD